MITVIGLGIDKESLTLKAINAIKKSNKIIVKTKLSKPYEFFEENNIEVESLDFLYEKAEDFDKLNQSIVDYLMNIKEDFIYCVDGTGFDDESVIELKNKTSIEIIPSVSYSSSILSACPTKNITEVFAQDFILNRAFSIDNNFTLIIKEIDSFYLASEVKLKLLNIYSEIDVFYMFENKVEKISLLDLDKKDFNHTSTVLIPSQGSYNKSRYNFTDLMEITYRLRDPDGCKWDRAQTQESIKSNVIEEAYELVEAVELDDLDKMIEETGDVLLQGVFHSVIAESTGDYDIYDVLTNLCDKLITRHTHIFGDVKAETGEEALKAWEDAKAKEKGHQTYSEKIKSIAYNLPALLKAYKVQKVAKKSGFDWDNVDGAIAKVLEELDEVKSADTNHLEEECGDLLFAVVNVLRFYDIDPEIALNSAIRKFTNRFNFIEEKVLSLKKEMKETSLEELEQYWCEAKALENENR